ncbi:MAG: hypothetical protein Kow0092_24260 [Deferrisomatales bacterium]
MEPVEGADLTDRVPAFFAARGARVRPPSLVAPRAPSLPHAAPPRMPPTDPEPRRLYSARGHGRQEPGPWPGAGGPDDSRSVGAGCPDGRNPSRGQRVFSAAAEPIPPGVPPFRLCRTHPLVP